MENIPQVLLKKLLLTFTIGICCFLFGIIYHCCCNDFPFMILSAAVFVVSAIKGAELIYIVKAKKYTIIEGLCSDKKQQKFPQKYSIVYIQRDEQAQIAIRLDSKADISVGKKYRLFLIGINVTAYDDLYKYSILGYEMIPS